MRLGLCTTAMPTGHCLCMTSPMRSPSSECVVSGHEVVGVCSQGARLACCSIAGRPLGEGVAQDCRPGHCHRYRWQQV